MEEVSKGLKVEIHSLQLEVQGAKVLGFKNQVYGWMQGEEETEFKQGQNHTEKEGESSRVLKRKIPISKWNFGLTCDLLYALWKLKLHKLLQMFPG